MPAASAAADRSVATVAPRLGAHVGRLKDVDVVAAAAAIGADIVQVFLGDPQDWKSEPLEGVDTEAVRASLREADLALVVHAPYVINVASTNNRIRIPSRKLLQQTMAAAAAVGAWGVVVHGGHVTASEDPQVGYDNWRKALDALETEVPVLIENTAGGDGAMVKTVEGYERLWHAIEGVAVNVGVTLDCCHAFSSGMDLATAADDLRAVTGRIDLVHANDSRDPAGSGRDRHIDLGEGTIGEEAVAHVIAQAGSPAVLETAGATRGHAADIAWLREQLMGAEREQLMGAGREHPVGRAR